jgi:signal transduction histidine kinase
MTTPRLSVRSYLVGLVMVVLLPLLAFSAFLVIHAAEREQAVMADVVRSQAEVLAAAIDRELAALRPPLFNLANASELRRGDLAGFYRRARDVWAGQGFSVALIDTTGQQLINTRVPFGTELPLEPDSTAVSQVLKTGETYISDLRIGALTHQPMVAIDVPVMRDDEPIYVLSLNITMAVGEILTQQGLPADWIADVYDRRGVTIARSREAERYVGVPGSPELIRRIETVDAGWFPSVSHDGVPVYNAYTHARLPGWTVLIGIPDQILFAPVRRSTWALSLAGAITLGLALLLAGLIGQRIAEPIVALAASADALGRGKPIALATTRMSETDAVACSLQQASQRLHHAAEERSELLQRSVAVQEAERQRIARELHDSLGQYLTALQLALNALRPLCLADPTAGRRLDELRSLTADLGSELNRLAWELRPTALDDLGVARAFTQYLEEWSERSDLHFDVQIDLGERRLPPSVETTLYRVLQEAVTNVVKHAGAERVGVILDVVDGAARLIVEDDGRGFPPADRKAGESGNRHFGLRGMRERLALIGGTLDIEATPDSGTTLFARVPL